MFQHLRGLLSDPGAWLAGDLPPDDGEDQQLALQAYAEYVEAQLDGFSSPDIAALRNELRAALQKESRSSDQAGTISASGVDRAPSDRRPKSLLSGTMGFAALMAVETRLVAALSDDDVERCYWIIRERFTRVGTPTAIAEHAQWAPVELREPAPMADLSPLAAAVRAESLALADAGRAALAVEAAKAAAASSPTEDHTAAIDAANASAREAVTAAAAAVARRISLAAEATAAGGGPR